MGTEKAELRFEVRRMRVADRGAECCLPDLTGERILQNHLEFLLDEEDEIYEGYGRRQNAYPYRQYNTYTRELSEREVKTAVLENRYLKAVFLPEYGGRLWELWDKEAGKNLLYTNDVIQFSNLAVRNAWFSGGVEWNIGVIGHNPFTIDSLYTARLKDERGNPILRMYEYERIRKVAYQMDFWLEPESRFLNCRMRIANESTEVVPMYWWSNMAVPEYDGGRIVVPAQKAFTYADGAVFKVDIPMVKGIDVTDYQKIERSVDYFFDIPEEDPKYIANVDRNGYGLLQLSTKRLRSRKLFCWGNQDASDHWQEFLTDQAGRYVEIQAGLAKTQYGCLPMAPNTAWEWLERYGAIQIPEENITKNHIERSRQLTEWIRLEGIPEDMEATLKRTKETAKKQALLLSAGSGYGALKAGGKLTKHLEFSLNSEALKSWSRFFETGILHKPDPKDAPDEFLIEQENVSFLEANREKNENNWYARYQLGIGYYLKEDYQKAEEEFRASFRLEENVWALHGLSCTCLRTERKKEAADYISRGILMRKKEVSFLKEGFKILYLCEAFGQICSCYEQLDLPLQNIGKIRFYYVSALHRSGCDKEAYGLLEKDGGLMMEDIREGEDSLAGLWCELNESLFGKKETVPHKYNFKAY